MSDNLQLALVVMPLRTDRLLEQKKDIITNIFGSRAILPAFYGPEDSEIYDVDNTIKMLKKVGLIIADLSYERPSCYYELGLAQALKTKTMIIAEYGSVIHQHYGEVNFYANLDEYRNKIKEAYESLFIN